MPRRPAPLPVPLALVAVLAVVAAPARADEPAEEAPSTEHYTLRAELGPELDTNAHRSETIRATGIGNPAPVMSPLGRAVLAATSTDVVGDNQQIALSATAAAKVFANSEARNEDVGILEGAALWRKPLGARGNIALSANYYEAFQRGDPTVYGADRRDFRSLAPTLRLGHLLGDSVEAGLGGGYRLFVFKSDHTYDFHGPTASLDARWARETADGTAEWEVAARGAYERRMFGGRQLVDQTACTPQPCPPTTGLAQRLDHYVTSALDIARTGRVLVGGGYGLQVNRSNSRGETVLRHFITARFAAALPLDLFLAARIEILIARYADPIIVAATGMAGRPYVSIEDENRNSARVELSRNFGERLQLIARYTFYANELRTGSEVSYRRQTALLSLAFNLEK